MRLRERAMENDQLRKVRRINAHLWAATGYCYVTRADGTRFRVSRVRTNRGILEGRVINGSDKIWERIEAGNHIELS